MNWQTEIKLDRKGGRDLRLQIYEQIKAQVESGAIEAGSRLPPSRELAINLSVARKTVSEAYQQLLTEGFLLTRGKGGTFVKAPGKSSSFVVPEQISEQMLVNLSAYGQSVRSLKIARIEPRDNVSISMYSSNPSIENTTLEHWFDRTVSRLKPLSSYGILSSAGNRKLRRSICEYVALTRGIDCNEEEIAVFSNFPQLIDLALRLHVSRGDRVVVEDPCYPAMRESAFAYGAEIIPVAVDGAGIRVEELPANDKSNPCKVLFLTATHQFPLGSVLSIERRHAVLEWASRAGTVVIDDDYDSDLFFKGFPPPALRSLANSELVVYVSSFKKLVPPGFSVDFAILPGPLVALYSQAMKLSVSQPSERAQLALAEFISSGEILRQSKRMKSMYSSRRQKLIESLKKHFGSQIQISGAPCGLDMVVQIQSNTPDSEIVRRAFDAGVEVETTQAFYCRKGVKGEFIVGFGSLDDQLIDEAVSRFAKAAGIR
jgi:GntR family transcriptional regulator / MocR family aminotransferase